MLITQGNSLAELLCLPFITGGDSSISHLQGLCFLNHENKLVSWHWNWTELTGVLSLISTGERSGIKFPFLSSTPSLTCHSVLQTSDEQNWEVQVWPLQLMSIYSKSIMAHEQIQPLLISTGMMYINTSDKLLFRFNSTAKNWASLPVDGAIQTFFMFLCKSDGFGSYTPCCASSPSSINKHTRKYLRIYTYTSLCVV